MEHSSDKIYKMTVLTVDDDPFILDSVSKYLTARGLRVVSTTDPESVVSLASKEKPRLIISDIAMPGMDGLALLNVLKTEPATRDIPLILLTSSKNAADIQEGLNAGAEAYLVKPIDWVQSWPKIQTILMRS
jgi:CheY-like chemotaxis protein